MTAPIDTTTYSTTIESVRIDGRLLMMVTVGGGTSSVGESDQPILSADDGRRLAKGIRMAVEQRIPLLMVITTAGVAVEEGLGASAAWAEAARELVGASGVVPTLAVASGPVVSGPALLLGLVDLVAFTADAYAYVNGPRNVEIYTGVPVSGAKLGGASTHARSSGLASFVADSVDDAIEVLTLTLSYLPDSTDTLTEPLPTNDPPSRTNPDVGELLPTSATGSYDVRDIITEVCDDNEFVEVRAAWAPNLVTGFASLGGLAVGVVANQTQALAGSIDIPASQKGARFVALCDAFNLPIVTMVDTSGFLPGKDLEWRGMIRHGAQLAFAYARATVPRIGLILRKSYGGAYIVMDSGEMGNDIMLAWPSAEVAVMGAKGAVEILHRKASAEERVELEQDYEAQYLTPYPAAFRSSINTVIDPAETRRELVAAASMLATKREPLRSRRHDNTPL